MPDDELPNEWGPTLADLAERRSTARSMGGAERLARHRALGKLDARARVDALLDPGTFRELGTPWATCRRTRSSPGRARSRAGR